MIEPTVVIGDCELYQGDARTILPHLATFDAIVTDPPYPDYHVEKFGYDMLALERLREVPCHQFIFWSARAEFPLNYTAIHIWDKAIGVGIGYERIFERNGGKIWRVFRNYFINSTLAASWQHDDYVDHPSQKPLKLMRKLIDLTQNITRPRILDPFMGSGTTGVTCVKNGRRFIGIEIDPTYFEMACDRLNKAYADEALFTGVTI